MPINLGIGLAVTRGDGPRGGPSFVALGGSVAYELGDNPVQLDDDAQVHDTELEALNGGDGDWTGAVLTVTPVGLASYELFIGDELLTLLYVGEGGLKSVADASPVADTEGGNSQALVLEFGGDNPITTAMVNEALRAIVIEIASGDEGTYTLQYTLTTPSGTATGSVSVVVSEPPSLLAQISTPTLAWGDIGAPGSVPYYSDAGTTPAVATNGVYRMAEHISGSQYGEQASASARPTLTAGSPRNYLALDGGDSLVTPSNLGKSGNFEAEMVCVAQLTTTGDQVIWAGGVSGARVLWAMACLSGNWVVAYGDLDIAFGAADTNKHVFRVVRNTGTGLLGTRLFIDGVEKAITGNVNGTNTPNLADAPLRFGHYVDGLPMTGRIDGGLYYATPLASDVTRAADDAAIMDWFGIG